MKITWLDLNASYSHSSLALPAIHAQCTQENEHEWSTIHTTINQPIQATIEKLLALNPDLVCATAWLFTHEQLLAILSRLKRINPHIIIALGGPEFLGSNEAYLRQNDFIDIVFRGEGEQVFHQWLPLIKQRQLWHTVEGACFVAPDGSYCDGAMARVMNFNDLKAPEESRFFQKERPFVQLETTRGCFNTCAFCVSGADKPVRSLPIESIRKRLEGYYQMGIHSIRMLDRTFNAQQKRAIELLHLFEEFNGKLTFHLEVHPAYLNPAVREAIARMPKGLLHIEAGIQSLNEEVLKKSCRLGKLADALDGLRFLSKLDNVETHADLIAGLPDYTLQMIVEDVYTLSDIGADEVQLESLKLLPGTKMRDEAQQLGLVFAPTPPYEVLQSNTMSFQEIARAMQISRVLDLFYNVDVWQQPFRACLAKHPNFLMDLCDYIHAKDMFGQPLSLEKKSILLLEFVQRQYADMEDQIIKYWILAGLSVNKLNLKGVKSYLLETEPQDVVSTLRGEFSTQHRNYIWNSFIWGYDRAKERQKPVYFALIQG